MELEQLRIFAALCETRSFSAAARRLYKSHSSVSRAVSALERELGVPLAVRDRSSFALTGSWQKKPTGTASWIPAAWKNSRIRAVKIRISDCRHLVPNT